LIIVSPPPREEYTVRLDADDGTAVTVSSLLRWHRERAGLTQEELAARARISVRTIGELERGRKHRPHAHTLRQIADALVLGEQERAALTDAMIGEKPGAATSRRAARPGVVAIVSDTGEPRAMTMGTDDRGGENAHAARGTTAFRLLREMPDQRRAADWGEAPDTAAFQGRSDELAMLARWVCDDRARVVALLGLGGIGKTMLAARLAHEISPALEYVFWRSLQNVLPFETWLDEALRFLGPERAGTVPVTVQARMALLLDALRQRRCLLVLDNWETILAPGQSRGAYRQGYEGYGQLLARLVQATHQSCLLITSREMPPELAGQDGARAAARSWHLRGLEVEEGRAILGAGTLRGDEGAWRDLLERCGRNPLALRLVADTIGDLFAGEIDAFLAEGVVVAGGMRQVLQEQVKRLTRTEQALMYWLAVAREPLMFAELAALLRPVAAPGGMQDALRALLHRSLVERGEGERTFWLQPVVLEYLTELLVETVSAEIRRGTPELLVQHPLLQAHAKDYVRQTQEHVIVAPILEQLTREHAAGEASAEQRLTALLAAWRAVTPEQQGYGPGSAVNLLRALRGHCAAWTCRS
jgi:transcriptional regulator with XRE-family HTH domain